jgi:hypothetical protein
MPAGSNKDTQKAPTLSQGFTAEERATMKERAKEMTEESRAAATRRAGSATCSRRSPRRPNRIAHGRPGSMPWPLDEWPDIPTRFLLCRQDRFFPAGFMRRLVRERLGVVPDEMDGGHLPALARSRELVEKLEACRIQHEPHTEDRNQ